MIFTTSLLIAFLFGCCLAIVFFGGLWWTVRILPTTRHPIALFCTSLLIRFSIVLTGVWCVMTQRELTVLAGCMIGFLTARFVVVRKLGGDHAGRRTVEGVCQ